MSGAGLTPEELDVAIAQTLRARTELAEKFGDRASHVFAIETVFALGDLFANHDDHATLVAIVNKMLEGRAPGFRLVAIN